MFKKKVLVISDNSAMVGRFNEIITDLDIRENFAFSQTICASPGVPGITIIDVMNEADVEMIIKKYELVISLHCKQLFPAHMVERVKCINIHPGYNPVNRGWYPQVFAILHSLETGATIHEMNSDIDHGRIIDRQKVEVQDWDTSFTLYHKIVECEIQLIRKNLLSILAGDYQSYEPGGEGNLYFKKDFEELRQIDMDRESSFGDFIRYLRAMSFYGHQNSYFIAKDGRKVFVSIHLEPEKI